MSAFNERASQWDSKSRRVKLARDVVASIIKHAKPDKNIDIADFGTGTGLILLGLEDYAKNMTGYDTSEGMLKVLEEKSAEAGLQNLSTAMLDINTGDFPQDSADLMTCNMVIHHLEHPEVFFCKAYDALRDGGKLCVSDLTNSDEPFHDDAQADVAHGGFDTEWVREAMANCGFKDVQVHTAAVVEKEREGRKVEFPIFLAVAEK